MCMHTHQSKTFSNIEEEIRCSKLLKSRAAKASDVQRSPPVYLAMAIFWRHFFSTRSTTTPTTGIKEKHKATLKALQIIQWSLGGFIRWPSSFIYSLKCLSISVSTNKVALGRNHDCSGDPVLAEEYNIFMLRPEHVFHTEISGEGIYK